MSRDIKVRDCMSATVIHFSPDTAVLDAIHSLVENRISGAPVMDDQGNLVGVLSERDCMKVTLQAAYYGNHAGKVSEYMSTSVQTVDADASLMSIAQRFLDRPYRRYPVMRDNRVVGIVSRRDVLRTMLSMHRAY